MTLYKWSQIAAADATADASINWQEGQAPSSINDSARAMMAATAKYRDDIAGAIVTGGTSTAYTVSSYEVFDSPARLNKQIIGFTPHVTNAGVATLNVDSLGAKPLRTQPGVDLVAGMLISGTPYTATYFDGDGAFYLHNFLANPYNVPIGAGMDYWGVTTPNSSFAFPTGQAISRTVYATLFGLVGTTYGAGDGSMTFNLPNKAGRVSAMKEAFGSLLTTAGGGVDGGTLGATGGAQNVTLSANQIPTITAMNASQPISVIGTSVGNVDQGITSSTTGGGAFGFNGVTTQGSISITSTGNNSISATYANSSQAATKLVPPTIICNYIMRIS